MPDRLYCDYCDTWLVRGLSQRARKEHIHGFKHREVVRLYYEKYLLDPRYSKVAIQQGQQQQQQQQQQQYPLQMGQQSNKNLQQQHQFQQKQQLQQNRFRMNNTGNGPPFPSSSSSHVGGIQSSSPMMPPGMPPMMPPGMPPMMPPGMPQMLNWTPGQPLPPLPPLPPGLAAQFAANFAQFPLQFSGVPTMPPTAIPGGLVPSLPPLPPLPLGIPTPPLPPLPGGISISWNQPPSK
jgi:hypothetical protein